VELTVKSIEMIIGIIKNRIGISANDIFGCGYNFMMAYIAQLTGCNVHGIEYMRTKVFIGMVSTIKPRNLPITTALHTFHGICFCWTH
jgi:hypothetical protein